jgi:hypothetical protein
VENFTIRKVSGGIIITVAGNGNYGFSGDGGPATNASFIFNHLYGGVAVDSAGNFYISDGGNNRIREVFSVAVSYLTTPGSLSFSASAGGSAPGTQTINLVSAIAGLAFTVSSSATWLSVTPSSGTMPATIQVSVDPSQLSAGTASGSVTITAAGAVQTIAVTFSVSVATPGVLGLGASTLSFPSPRVPLLQVHSSVC